MWRIQMLSKSRSDSFPKRRSGVIRPKWQLICVVCFVCFVVFFVWPRLQTRMIEHVERYKPSESRIYASKVHKNGVVKNEEIDDEVLAPRLGDDYDYDYGESDDEREKLEKQMKQNEYDEEKHEQGDDNDKDKHTDVKEHQKQFPNYELEEEEKIHAQRLEIIGKGETQMENNTHEENPNGRKQTNLKQGQNKLEQTSNVTTPNNSTDSKTLPSENLKHSVHKLEKTTFKQSTDVKGFKPINQSKQNNESTSSHETGQSFNGTQTRVTKLYSEMTDSKQSGTETKPRNRTLPVASATQNASMELITNALTPKNKTEERVTKVVV